MRTLSLTMRQAIFEQETGKVGVALLTFTHPLLPEPIRVSSDPTMRLSDTPLEYGTISRGQTYRFLPVAVSLPDDVGDRAPTASIQIENVSRAMVALLRSTITPAIVSIEFVLASAPDVVEIDYPEMELVGVNYSSGVMTIELSINALTDEPCPAGSFDPSGFPGLF